jgi:hypothetical protein
LQTSFGFLVLGSVCSTHTRLVSAAAKTVGGANKLKIVASTINEYFI